MKVPDYIFKRLTIAHTIIFSLIILAAIGKGLSSIPKLKEKLAKETPKVTKPIFNNEPIVVENFEIKIPATEAREIEKLINHLRSKRIMTNEDKRWFSAAFYDNGVKYKCKIRPRGDGSVHWKYVKRSWRVKFSKNKLFRGMREINLVIPLDKGYVNEPLANELAKQAGLLVPQHGYARAKINNVDMGAYLWFEQWDRSSMESRQTPNSEIYGENNVWIDTKTNGTRIDQFFNLHASYKEMTRKDEESKLHATRWNDFLDLVFHSTDEVFYKKIADFVDLNKYHHWNAISWLFNSTHCHWGDNLRWYFNTTTNKFEPIAYDVFFYPFQPEKGLFEAKEYDPIAKRLYRINEYQIHRNKLILEKQKWMEANAEKFQRAHFSAIYPGLTSGIGQDKLNEKSFFETMESQISTIQSIQTGIYSQLSHARIFANLDLRKLPNKISLTLTPEAIGGINLHTISIPVVTHGQIKASIISPKGKSHPLSAVSKSGAIEIDGNNFLISAETHDNFALKQTHWIIELSLSNSKQSLGELTIDASNANTGLKIKPDFIYSSVRTN